MTKRITTAAIAIAWLLGGCLWSDPQYGSQITVTAGAAIRLVLNPSTAAPVRVNSIFIQPVHGATTGLVYVLNAPPNVTCTNGASGTVLVAELAAASTTQPGQSFTFPSNDSATNVSSGTDLRYWCIDGATSGTVVAASWDIRQ